jgi:alternate signal-mediated exported protein
MMGGAWCASTRARTTRHILPRRGTTMNKLTKAAIATAVGAALLIGGTGTFAYWNAQTGVAGGNIVAGQLSIADVAPTAGAWTVQKNGTGTATAVTLSSFRASPGDVLTYTKNVTVTATGDNLTATLSLAANSITANSTSVPADVALAGYLTKTATIAITSALPSTITVGAGNTYVLTPGTTGIVAQPLTVSAVITFPKNVNPGTTNGTQENPSMTGSVNLTGLAINLNQS